MRYWDEYRLEGTVNVGIWRKVGGVWSLFATEPVGISAQVQGEGQQTANWSLSATFSLGPGVTDFGVTIESHTGIAAALTNLDISYTSQASSGTRSATPGGETTRATVRP